MEKEKKRLIESNEDIFEINDFTVVTDLEVFIASLENVLHDKEWFSNDKFEDEKTQSVENTIKKIYPTRVSYSNIEFDVIYFADLEDKSSIFSLVDCNFDHLSSSAIEMILPLNTFDKNVITKQFGVFEYVLLVPVVGIARRMKEDLINQVLSGLTPIFVEVGDHGKDLYAGILQNRNTRTLFEAATLRTFLNKLKYLEGLMDMFKNKLNTPLDVDQQIQISIEIDYVYNIDEETNIKDEDNLKSKSSTTCLHDYNYEDEKEALE